MHNLTAIEDGLMNAQREGKTRDEPEGSRFIMLSDTLAKRWAQSIGIAKEIIMEDRGEDLKKGFSRHAEDYTI